MFVALVPPPEVSGALEHFLEPRWEAEPALAWTPPEQWHVTLAFLPEVGEGSVPELVARLGRAGRKRRPMELRLDGGGVFPNPYEAKVLFLRLDLADEVNQELHRLATGVRHAAGRAGASPAAGRLQPHLTIARARRPFAAIKWLTVLSAWRSEDWICSEFRLIDSVLGAGPGGHPLYRTVATLPLG